MHVDLNDAMRNPNNTAAGDDSMATWQIFTDSASAPLLTVQAVGYVVNVEAALIEFRDGAGNVVLAVKLTAVLSVRRRTDDKVVPDIRVTHQSSAPAIRDAAAAAAQMGKLQSPFGP